MITNSATEVRSGGDSVESEWFAPSGGVSEMAAQQGGSSWQGVQHHLTPTHRRLLEAWVRAGTTPQRVARRARIVLLAAEGLSARAIARTLGVSPHTVARWRRQFQKSGPQTLLRDAPGRGRKATLAGSAVARIRALLERRPVDGGRWTIRRIAEATGISRASVHRILRAEGLALRGARRPHRRS